jgi:hypothetical protein
MNSSNTNNTKGIRVLCFLGIITFLLFDKAFSTQIFVGEKCTDEIVLAFSSKLVDDDDDEKRLKEWLSIDSQRNLACEALKGYQNRQHKRIRSLIGLSAVNGPAFIFAMVITISSDGGTEPILNQNWIYGSLGVSVVNALIWIPMFIKNRVTRTEPEKKMLLEYKNYANYEIFLNRQTNFAPCLVVEF